MENKKTVVDNSRIAKNTVLLYCRTILIMLITLYTSRVILQQLGVEDYGIYNVIGGMVAMFSVISSALSSAISRFITFELGKDDKSRLLTIFSTSINIQLLISLIILVLGEMVGVWFLNYKMAIPPDRLTPANWVLQFSLLTFCVNLISVPYNACIIAHEKMTAFAYISLTEAILKLVICYMLSISMCDRLIIYSFLMLLIALAIRLMYGIYCHRKFEECNYTSKIDKKVFKEMASFAGWNFFTNIAWVFNTQGITLLVNIFFGVTCNAARGLAAQVESAVMQFVNNFTTAINPQITKSYAANEKENMFILVCRGAKFSYFLLLLFAIPLILETDYVLSVWLNQVPDHTVVFVRLSIIISMVNILGNTCYTACMATGDIKKYVILITSIGLLPFPLTLCAFYINMPVESAYYIYIAVYSIIDIARLYIMKTQLKFPYSLFLNRVIVPVILTTSVACILPCFIYEFLNSSVYRFFMVCVSSLISSVLVISYLGLTANERVTIITYVKNKIYFK